jgi:hypothetical protein
MMMVGGCSWRAISSLFRSAGEGGGTPLRVAAGLERSVVRGKTNRDWGHSLVERPSCAAPLLYTWSTSPSARHIYFLYIYLCVLDGESFYVAYLPFRLRIISLAIIMEGMVGPLSIIPAASRLCYFSSFLRVVPSPRSTFG